jgi:hypothetical protein
LSAPMRNLTMWVPKSVKPICPSDTDAAVASGNEAVSLCEPKAGSYERGHRRASGVQRRPELEMDRPAMIKIKP